MSVFWSLVLNINFKYQLKEHCRDIKYLWYKINEVDKHSWRLSENYTIWKWNVLLSLTASPRERKHLLKIKRYIKIPNMRLLCSIWRGSPGHANSTRWWKWVIEIKKFTACLVFLACKLNHERKCFCSATRVLQSNLHPICGIITFKSFFFVLFNCQRQIWAKRSVFKPSDINAPLN